jgi:hypothetical protein
MIAHLKNTFPEKVGILDDEKIRQLVQSGMKRAESYDVIYENDIQPYLEYMVIYGPEFDSDPATAWAGDILRIENLHGSIKMQRIGEQHRQRRGSEG